MLRPAPRHVLPTTLVLALLAPAGAQANVNVSLLSNENDPEQLASFRTAKCQRATKKKALLKFIATAKSSGYTLRVNMFKAPSRFRTITYGGDGDVDFTVTGPRGSWTNLNRPPNSPPGGGGISFNAKRTRMGLGFSPAFDEGAATGISVAGGLTCKYPKKKRKKR